MDDAFVIAWINGLIFFLMSPFIPFDVIKTKYANAIKTTCSDIKQSRGRSVFVLHLRTKSSVLSFKAISRPQTFCGSKSLSIITQATFFLENHLA